MKAERSLAWNASESGFACDDGTRLFYRTWQPAAPRHDSPRRALVFLHRGHEHSGRVWPLVEQFGFTGDWAFAWDARGHGHSPGERGDAPGFDTLVADFDAFIRHIVATHGIDIENILVVANSVGAVIAATWLHDYAPRVRGVIMAAAAFEIKLYVPLAKPALRFARRFKPELFVTSYIRPGMLTHSPQEAAAYAADPLIAKAISARVLLGLADTAKRIVEDAAAIDTPVLMLAAGKDFVVKEGPQQRFYERLSSPLKRYVRLPDAFHALFYEQDTSVALDESRRFVEDCYARAPTAASHYLAADRDSHSARRYAALQAGESCGALTKAWFGLQRVMLGMMGPVSDGMKIGLRHGFDSGASLDYVYRNQEGGRFVFGKIMDRGYLDAVGWRGIRQRKRQLQQLLEQRIAAHQGDAPLRILDVAAGSGRYVLETVKRFQDKNIEVTLRDFTQHNLDQARALAGQLQLNAKVDYQLRDAFSPDSYRAAEGLYDIAVVSGLYELFSDNAPVAASLQGIAGVLRDGGYLIYTGQPWHPQLDMIALTLTSHRGTPWLMRPRPQAEMDALVAGAGYRKVATSIGLEGIFTVSLARKPAAPAAAG
ncbi:alpha-beta hydrolase superfamily lysophospholipase [Duganella sp. 1411]|uniref:bifunctional alpha/beta hydrolase/class I SAM-dependent methyltransferase n=1 Tax=Duganella sp. 1411 TaxID=2806572 RepID=UPI001AEA6F1B|nr:bifunctional alpha/beta hydrolase/class I SAM-dependent methyltransferase [Duganella sp. 1411]MBP1204469.1 alpha-beta hydrolase superfamily lysophospholipase [Duganella sp. 1411]